MQDFLSRHAPVVTGVLSGFDRLVFRGTLISLVRPMGMYSFLCRSGVRLLDFKKYVQATSERVKEAALREAHRLERPIRYLQAAHVNKEELAKRLLAEHPVDEGLVCAFRTVEPCMSFEYHCSSDKEKRGLQLRPRKCLHIYKYYLHRVFGFIGVRLQTWFPFSIQICINGREWLGWQLARRGDDDLVRHDNCFTHIGNVARAQRLLDGQLKINWTKALGGIARALNPIHDKIFEAWPQDYYWSAYQSEWATDVMFKDPKSLAAIYPGLVRHATLHFQSPDVMRFLERKTHGNFTGELVSSFKQRPEGVRVKHWVHGNSIKMYDKGGSVLRVETTVARPEDFKTFRQLHDKPKSKYAWRPVRRGIADLHARAQASGRANANYLDALATVADETDVATVLDPLSRPVTYRGRRHRPLRPTAPEDVALLRAVSNGAHAVAGFRNRDVRLALHPRSSAKDRGVAARIGRQLRLLRAHGLIRRIAKTHRYQLTDRGRQLAAAVFAMRGANLKQLLEIAA